MKNVLALAIGFACGCMVMAAFDVVAHRSVLRMWPIYVPVAMLLVGLWLRSDNQRRGLR